MVCVGSYVGRTEGRGKDGALHFTSGEDGVVAVAVVVGVAAIGWQTRVGTGETWWEGDMLAVECW